MNKRQLSAMNTRQKLINAALKILRQNGFNTVNVEDITKAAGVAKGSFYTYFKRKEDIVLEICRKPFHLMLEDLENNKEQNIVQKLSNYFKKFMECIEIYDIYICRSWIQDVIDPQNATKDWDSQKWLYDEQCLQKIIQNAVQNKELAENTPVDLLTHIIICELYGMMLCWCMSDGKFEPLEWTEKFCDFQIKNILKPYLL